MKKLILMVEDDAQVSDTVSRYLSECGYDVLVAADVRQAMLILDNHPSVELIFTDINLPGTNGFAFADMVKVRRPMLPILYATGSDVESSKHFWAGTVHGEIIQKPYTLHALTSKMADIVR